MRASSSKSIKTASPKSPRGSKESLGPKKGIDKKRVLLRYLTIDDLDDENLTPPVGFPPPPSVTDSLPPGSTANEYKLWMKKQVALSEWKSAIKVYRNKQELNDQAACDAILKRVTETNTKLNEDISQLQQLKKDSFDEPQENDTGDDGNAVGGSNEADYIAGDADNEVYVGADGDPQAEIGFETDDTVSAPLRSMRPSHRRPSPFISRQNRYSMLLQNPITEDETVVDLLANIQQEHLSLQGQINQLQVSQGTMQDCITLLLEDQLALENGDKNNGASNLEDFSPLEARVGALEDKVEELDESQAYTQLLQRLAALEEKLEQKQEKTNRQIEAILLNQKSFTNDLEALNSRVATLGTICKKLNEKVYSS